MSNFEFSSRTKEILSNFYAINPSLLFREGNVLKTISPSKDIFAIATIVEVIPKEYAIYDLSRFLGAMSLFDNVSLVFKDKSVIIKDDTRKLNYVYASSTMIISAPDKDVGLPDTLAEFELSAKQLLEANKALNLLKLPEVVFVSDGTSIVLQAADVKNPTGDVYSTQVGGSAKPFKVIFKAEKMSKLLEGDYKVTITYGEVGGAKQGIAVFETKDVKYYVGPESESQF